MASKNQLLGHGSPEEIEESEIKNEAGPVKLYRHDVPEGREFEGAETIKMMKHKGWSEVSPNPVEKEPESGADIGSFFDFSDEKE